MAVANITNAGLVGDNFRLAAMISREINLLLSDTASLRNTDKISYVGSVNGLGSNVISVRKYGLDGRNLFRDSAAEDTDNSGNFDDVDAEVANITVARKYLIRKISDLASMVGFGDADLNPFILAADMANSYEAKFADMTADAASGFTAFKGNASDEFSFDVFFNGIFGLEQADSFRGADPDFCAVLHPKALTELQDSLRNETSNAVSMMQATEDMLMAKGKGYMGKLFGVDLYRSSYVNSNGGAYESFMISKGALGYADGIPMSLPNAVDFITEGKVLVEMERTGMSALTNVIGHCYLGIGIITDAKGILLKSTT